MVGSEQISDVMTGGGFRIHYYVGRIFKVGFGVQCVLIAAFCASILFAASLFDKTLFLESRNVGLLEHPAIWAFLGLQIALPIWIKRSIEKIGAVEEFSQELSSRLRRFLRLQDVASRVAMACCYIPGFIAFVWNTYQNQLPGIIVPYDFWDSSNHLFGYWTTRVYKFYLFVWLLPYIALLHIGILFVTLRTIRDWRLHGKFKLQLFHPDNVGGLGFVPGLVTNPIVITLLVASIPLAGAFQVHKALDITPIMGSAIVLIGALVAYIIPILHLRKDLVALKRDTVERLRLLQQRYYSRISERKTLDFEAVRRANEALDYFEKICARVKSISNYPHFYRLLKFMGLAMTPSALLLVINSYKALSPLIGLFLKPA
jgi:hypothetical protein